ncbi:Glycosyltransferase involved in cell wall bisynthesis [Desulfuromusa kysingii]|uniref:Glycosyltransferase involved in cell wall bisynthesis n=2 Tax=Desulfuromusa kysingii TaxID=37625 RepID=A0A1H4BA54_9BACT|nr:Glycosyltransferase involved in cell wall bisynthesis [Desulfuromusa kysingii]
MHVVISMVVGGAERLVYDMVRYPEFADNPPIVCCMDSLGDLGQKLQAEGYKVYCKGRKQGFDFEMIAWLRAIIKVEQVEVVHAHQYSPLVYATPAAFLAGRKKVVYTEHGRFYPDRKSWKRTLINPLLALGVDHLVSISAATAEAMATYDNFPRKRIQVIHNGINCTAMNPDFDIVAKKRDLALDDKSHIIGTAARLNSIKNIPMMLRGFKLVLQFHPDCCLVIAGQGEEEEQLKIMAFDLGIAEKVKFIGLRFDLPEIYQMFDVFLLTSFSEGISVTLLESMASRVPSVVTDVGGNGEVTQDGITGYLVTCDNDDHLAQRINELLHNPALAKKMGAAAQKRVNETFSVVNMMNNYMQMYR